MPKAIFDHVTGQYLVPQINDSVRGPRDAPHAPTRARTREGEGDYSARVMEREARVRERAHEAMTHVNPPPAGFPADPREWLAYLQLGDFTAAQMDYLQNPTALAQYKAGASGARARGDTAGADLADEIIRVWETWLSSHPGAPVNPFEIGQPD